MTRSMNLWSTMKRFLESLLSAYNLINLIVGRPFMNLFWKANEVPGLQRIRLRKQLLEENYLEDKKGTEHSKG